jgi:outer membrane protein OmpA-like peptidoglycan-associated protein
MNFARLLVPREQAAASAGPRAAPRSGARAVPSGVAPLAMLAAPLGVRPDREASARAIASGAATGGAVSPSSRAADSSPLERRLAAEAERAGGGERVPGELRDELEPRLGGADLGSVRLHDDAHARALTRSVGANALTIGDDVFFAPGRLDASSRSGRELLSHELTHVAQQADAGGGAQADGDLAMTLPVPQGWFEIDMRDVPVVGGAKGGMRGTIKFNPAPKADYSAQLELLQLIKYTNNTGAAAGSDFDWTGTTEAGRNRLWNTGAGGSTKGWMVDTFTDPATFPMSSAHGPYYRDAAGTVAGFNEPGWVRDASDTKPAMLWDFPGWTNDLKWDFETLARGHDNQRIYGALRWGFELRAGIPSVEYATASGAASANLGEALDRFRTMYTHEPTIIYFDTDIDTPTTITPEAAKITEAATWLAAHSDAQVELDGYADETGPAGHNHDLANRRANRVAALLTAAGVSASRITRVTEHGRTHEHGGGAPGTGVFAALPGHAATTAGTLRANRRVVITFVRTATTPP